MFITIAMLCFLVRVIKTKQSPSFFLFSLKRLASFVNELRLVQSTHQKNYFQWGRSKIEIAKLNNATLKLAAKLSD